MPKKAGGTFLCKFFNSAKTDFKKGGLVLHFLLCCRLGVPARYSVARAILKSSNRRGLHKTDSAQSVNNESQKSIRYFFEYIKKDTALKYPSKAVHIIHMMGEEIFYVRIFVCFYFLCKKIFNFFLISLSMSCDFRCFFVRFFLSNRRKFLP